MASTENSLHGQVKVNYSAWELNVNDMHSNQMYYIRLFNII